MDCDNVVDLAALLRVVQILRLKSRVEAYHYCVMRTKGADGVTGCILCNDINVTSVHDREFWDICKLVHVDF